MRLAILAVAALLCVSARVFADVASDYSLALPNRFVQVGLDGQVAMQAYDMAMPDTSAASQAQLAADAAAAAPEEVQKTSRGRKILMGSLFFLGIEALLALPSTAAYADEDGKTLAAVDAGFAAMSLINPSATMGETVGAAVGVLALAGTVLAIGDEKSKDELFFINWAGLNVAIFGGRWVGSLFER